MTKKRIGQIAGVGAAALLVSTGALFCYNNSNDNNQKTETTTVSEATKEPLEAKKVSTKETDKKTEKVAKKVNGVTIHYKWDGDQPHLYYSVDGTDKKTSFPGVPMKNEGNGWYTYTVEDAKEANVIISVPSKDFQTSEFSRDKGEYWYDEANGWSTTEPDNYTEPKEQEVVSESDKKVAADQKVTVHFPGDWDSASIYYWNVLPNDKEVDWPGEQLEKDEDGYYSYTFESTTKANFLFTNGDEQTEDFTQKSGEWWYNNGKWSKKKPGGSSNGGSTSTPIPFERTDFREDTIYFLMTTRFYDGDSSNNRYCWDGPASNKANNDPEWRGDFKGVVEKLDYIKALGFSAIWITPVVENASGYDYHGYHALDFSKVYSRYESEDMYYQDFINACHEKGIKVIQDIVLNHTGNWGEANLYQMFEKGEDDGEMSPSMVKAGDKVDNLEAAAQSRGGSYDDIIPDNQYGARIDAMKEDKYDTDKIYHHCKSLSWNGEECQLGQIAGDCVDLNTENPTVYKYLNECYTKYINMGVDAFRVDTVKHISRLTFNKAFLPAFREAGGENFYMFGECCARYNEVWNEKVVPLSVCFYTWDEWDDFAWSDTDESVNSASASEHFEKYKSAQDSQPKSNNAFLNGNDYHEPDRSKASGFEQIDFMMHWGFRDAGTAFSRGLTEDEYFNDSTWNVTYVDSHDYAPDNAPENQRFAGTQDTWAENLDLMFTFRGIPCIYYGSEIEFKKGCAIDVGPKAALEETGRAYFGDHIEGSVTTTDYGVYSGATGKMAETLNYPLAKHIQRLNLIRRAIPALQKGQYSTEGVSGGIAYKRRYTSGGTDSFVCVTISGDATFSGIPSGTYVDVITGDTVQCGGTLTASCSGKGNMRVYVLQTSGAPSGKIGEDGAYLK